MTPASPFPPSRRTPGGAPPARATPSAPPAATRAPACSSDLTPLYPVRRPRRPSPGPRLTATPSAMRRRGAARPPPPSLRCRNQPPPAAARLGTAFRWTPAIPRRTQPSQRASGGCLADRRLAVAVAAAADPSQTRAPWTLTRCPLTKAWSSRILAVV